MENVSKVKTKVSGAIVATLIMQVTGDCILTYVDVKDPYNQVEYDDHSDQIDSLVIWARLVIKRENIKADGIGYTLMSY